MRVGFAVGARITMVQDGLRSPIVSTAVVRVDPLHPDPSAIAAAADVLRRGGLVAFPTETVYGLGAHALDRDAVRRVFTAKGRPAQDPLIVHVADVAAVYPLVIATPDVLASLAIRFWPGPLTIVLRRAAHVPDEVTAGLDTVAVRVPAHPVARALLTAAAVPIAAPSANLFSRPSPTRAGHVLEDLDGRIDMVVDGGPTTVGVESTVLDLSRERPLILRPGAVTPDMLRGVIGDVELTPDARVEDTAGSDTAGMRSPGLLTKHYSPRAPLTLYSGDPARVVARIAADARAALGHGERVGILAADEDRAALPDGACIVTIGAAHDLASVATRLYSALRELDAAQVDRILARGFGGEGLGVAIADRLRRAAAGHLVEIE